MNDYYTQLATAIIASQEEVIGSIAWEQAQNVEGLVIENKTVHIVAPNEEQVVNGLVDVYKMIFGQAAVEVCKAAARRVVQGGTVDLRPVSLR